MNTPRDNRENEKEPIRDTNIRPSKIPQIGPFAKFTFYGTIAGICVPLVVLLIAHWEDPTKFRFNYSDWMGFRLALGAGGFIGCAIGAIIGLVVDSIRMRKR